MSPLFAPVVQKMLSKIDMFHLLQVLSGADTATPEEVGQLITLRKILVAPVAGDMAWAKITELANTNGMSEMVLGYITDGLNTHCKEAAIPTSLASAKDSIVLIMDAIINNPEITQLAAVCGCPRCGFVFGIQK